MYYDSDPEKPLNIQKEELEKDKINLVSFVSVDGRITEVVKDSKAYMSLIVDTFYKPISSRFLNIKEESYVLECN